MRKALMTAFLIAGGLAAGCSGAPAPVSATHVVAGEASVHAQTIRATVISNDNGGHGDSNGPPGAGGHCVGSECNGHGQQ